MSSVRRVIPLPSCELDGSDFELEVRPLPIKGS